MVSAARSRHPAQSLGNSRSEWGRFLEQQPPRHALKCRAEARVLDGGGGARYFTAFSHLPERRNRNVQAPPAPQGRLQEAQGATRPTQAVNPRAVSPTPAAAPAPRDPVAAAPARRRLGSLSGKL